MQECNHLESDDESIPLLLGVLYDLTPGIPHKKLENI